MSFFDTYQKTIGGKRDDYFIQFELVRGIAMQVHVNKGFLGRRHAIDGSDSGFSPITPGDYLARFDPNEGLSILKRTGDASYLKLSQFEEKIAMGVLVVIAI